MHTSKQQTNAIKSGDWLVWVRRISGVVALFTALVANPLFLYRFLGRVAPFSVETVQNIVATEIALALLGLACLLPEFCDRFLRILGVKRAALWLFEPCASLYFWLSLLPFFIGSLLRQSPLWEQSPYLWKQLLLASLMAESALVSALIHTGLIAMAVKIVKHPSVGWLTAVSLALLDFIDWAFIYYGHMRINVPSIFGAGQGAIAYGNIRTTLMFLFFMACSVSAVVALKQLRMKKEFVFGQRRLAWFALLVVLSPTVIARRIITAPMPAVQREIVAEYLLEVRPMSQPPLLSIVQVFLTKQGSGTTAAYTADEARLLEPYRATGVVPPPLPGPPFRRIILITMESLSLNVVSRYNPALPGQLTPTLDSLPASHGNFRSVAIPTQYGIASHLCSHPYGIGLVEMGHPNALPAYLSKHGWDTAYFQSASLDFQRGNRRFAELGYGTRFGRDEAAKQSAMREHIGEWGLRDRQVYAQAINYLETRRSEPTFLHILTADTHGPSGRLDYGNQEYPPYPNWIQRYPTAGIYLKSWFRADYDLGIFLGQLRAKGLLDEDTAVIITGDHNCPMNPIYRAIPRPGKIEHIERIPWILLSPRKLPSVESNELASQVNTAPTIAHLAGLPSLAGWWGQSLLAASAGQSQLAWREGEIYLVSRTQITEIAPPDLVAAAKKVEVR